MCSDVDARELGSTGEPGGLMRAVTDDGVKSIVERRKFSLQSLRLRARRPGRVICTGVASTCEVSGQCPLPWCMAVGEGDAEKQYAGCDPRRKVLTPDMSSSGGLGDGGVDGGADGDWT